MLTPEAILYGVVAFSWLEYTWGAYLGLRQKKIYKNKTKVPKELEGIVDQETFDKARLYALDNAKFGFVKGVFDEFLSTILMLFFAFKLFWDKAGSLTHVVGSQPSNEIVRSLVFIWMFNLFSTIIGIPFKVYKTFVIEERHGFNQQTTAFFIKDQIKAYFISQIIMLPLMAAIIKIIEAGGDYFFVYLWVFVFGFTIFMMIVYPEFIAPLFDKYTPLPEGELRTQIETLAASIGFPLYKLFVVEGSKRSTHSNAYFYGFFKFKRIVLFDTLLEENERRKLKTEEELKEADEKAKDEDEAKKKKMGCNNGEILAVLSHELGHWKLNHVLKNIIISEVHIFLMFAMFGYLYKNQMLYTAFGFDNEQPILIGLMIIMQFITAPYNTVLEFAMTCLSRRFEFQADAFAVNLGKAKELRTALIKLNNDNLSFPIYDWLYSAFHHSHPPLLERLAALEEPKSKRE